jgi:hypothetical protein
MLRLKIGHKLIIGFLVIGMIPLTVFGMYALRNGSDSLSRQSRNQLVSVREIKRDQLEHFIQDRKTDLDALVETVRVLRQEALRKLSVAQQINKAGLLNFFEKVKNDVTLLAAGQDALQVFVKIRT